MANDKVAFSFRLSSKVNEYVSEEAERLGMSKNSFLQFLIASYRTEQEQTGHIRMSNEEMYKVVREQVERELRS